MKMKKTCRHKVTKKIAESCGYLIFLPTFAKKLKDRELGITFKEKRNV
jgi:hypothetical protein